MSIESDIEIGLKELYTKIASLEDKIKAIVQKMDHWI